jgi:hypothetical protein
MADFVIVVHVLVFISYLIGDTVKSILAKLLGILINKNIIINI